MIKLTPEKWLEKFEQEGKADEVFLIIHGREYTPRQITSMDYIFWKQVVKSVKGYDNQNNNNWWNIR